jgi:hypothetical protein
MVAPVGVFIVSSEGPPAHQARCEQLARGLSAAAAACLGPKEAVTVLSELMNQRDGEALTPLVRGLVSAAARVEAKDSAGVCQRAAATLIQAISKGQQDVPGLKERLVESLASVLRREAFWQSRSPRCGVVAAVGTLGNPATRLGAPALLQPAFHSPPPPLPAETLVGMLKGPLCVGEAQWLVLEQLGRRYGRSFADQWDFVRFAIERKFPLDLLSPPQRPPAPGRRVAIGHRS